MSKANTPRDNCTVT